VIEVYSLERLWIVVSPVESPMGIATTIGERRKKKLGVQHQHFKERDVVLGWEELLSRSMMMFGRLPMAQQPIIH
jgi:hypothetical protein